MNIWSTSEAGCGKKRFPTLILYLSHFWRVNPYSESSKILIFATVANVIMLSISKLFTRPKDRNWMNGSGPRAMQPLERAYTICLKKVLLCKWLSLWFFFLPQKSCTLDFAQIFSFSFIFCSNRTRCVKLIHIWSYFYLVGQSHLSPFGVHYGTNLWIIV